MAFLRVCGASQMIPDGFPGRRGTLMLSGICPPLIVNGFNCMPAGQLRYVANVDDDGSRILTRFTRYVPPAASDLPSDKTRITTVAGSLVWGATPITALVAYGENATVDIGLVFEKNNIRFHYYDGVCTLDVSPIADLLAVAVCRWNDAKISLEYGAVNQAGDYESCTATGTPLA